MPLLSLGLHALTWEGLLVIILTLLGALAFGVLYLLLIKLFVLLECTTTMLLLSWLVPSARLNHWLGRRVFFCVAFALSYWGAFAANTSLMQSDSGEADLLAPLLLALPFFAAFLMLAVVRAFLWLRNTLRIGQDVRAQIQSADTDKKAQVAAGRARAVLTWIGAWCLQRLADLSFAIASLWGLLVGYVVLSQQMEASGIADWLALLIFCVGPLLVASALVVPVWRITSKWMAHDGT